MKNKTFNTSHIKKRSAKDYDNAHKVLKIAKNQEKEKLKNGQEFHKSKKHPRAWILK